MPGIGVAHQIARDPYRSFQRIAREYGDIVLVPAPGPPLILVSHPDHVNHVMTRNAARYGKPSMTRDVIFREPPRFHGMADGEEWRSVRRMLNPRFSERGLAPLSELMIDSIVDSIDGWERFAGTRAVVDMQHEFSVLTMSVLLRSMFSMQPDRADVDRAAKEFAALLRGAAIWMLTSGLPGWVPRPRARRTEAAMAWILAYIDRMISARRCSPIEGEDLLTTLLEARFEDGSAMSDEHIRRELVGLMIGGYETTAAVMSWVLARFPFEAAAREAAYVEVDALGGDRVRHEDMERLTWLRACFDEAQRLQGFPINPREALEDDEIGGYAIPRGAVVGISGWTLHRDPRWWREPERFQPRRFLEDEINKYAFVPFGVGPRRCLGIRMGYMVGLFTLATVLQRFRLEPLRGWTPQPAFAFSSLVKGGVPMTIERRSKSP